MLGGVAVHPMHGGFPSNQAGMEGESVGGFVGSRTGARGAVSYTHLDVYKRQLNEGAGVDHDQIGFGHESGTPVALTGQPSLQLVRVNLVLGAPQSLQPVPTLDHSFSSQPAGAATVAGHGAPAGADILGSGTSHARPPSGEGGI